MLEIKEKGTDTNAFIKYGFREARLHYRVFLIVFDYEEHDLGAGNLCKK